MIDARRIFDSKRCDTIVQFSMEDDPTRSPVRPRPPRWTTSSVGCAASPASAKPSSSACYACADRSLRDGNITTESEGTPAGSYCGALIFGGKGRGCCRLPSCAPPEKVSAPLLSISPYHVFRRRRGRQCYCLKCRRVRRLDKHGSQASLWIRPMLLNADCPAI